MGGNVFKLPSDYIAEGIAEGKAEGIAEGKAEGILLERIAAVTKKVKRGQELPIIAEALDFEVIKNGSRKQESEQRKDCTER